MRTQKPTRIQSIHFNRDEKPTRASIWTPRGSVRVEWRDVAGDWCWFSTGSFEAKKTAVLVIQRIEQMCQSMG